MPGASVALSEAGTGDLGVATEPWAGWSIWVVSNGD